MQRHYEKAVIKIIKLENSVGKIDLIFNKSMPRNIWVYFILFLKSVTKVKSFVSDSLEKFGDI